MTDNTTPTERTESTDEDGSTNESADWSQATHGLRGLADRLSMRTVSLQTTDPEDDLTDLAPLADHLRDARVVALGEATHGTREFFRLKHRLIWFLVQRLDYRLVALEANFAETLAIDEYVVHGRGNAKDALEGTRFWTWNTDEVLALIEWLRGFNADRPLDDRVRFYGIDAQFTAGPAEALTEFLDDHDPDWLARHRETLEMLADDGLADLADGDDADDGDDTDNEDDERVDEEGGADDDDQNTDDEGQLPEQAESRLHAAESLVDALDDWFTERRTGDPADDGDEFALHRRHLRTLEQAVERARLQAVDDDETTVRHRDRLMAENLTWILDHERHERVVLWAHGEHVQRCIRERHWGTGDSMGRHLIDRYGDDYYAVGFDFAEGEFRAIGPVENGDGQDLRGCSLGPPPEGAATRLFTTVDEPLWFADFDAVTADDRLAEWFDQERAVRSVGAFYDPDNEHERHHVRYRLPQAFDALLFVEETSRARPVDGD